MKRIHCGRLMSSWMLTLSLSHGGGFVHAAASAGAALEVLPAGVPAMVFDNTDVDAGMVREGSVARTSFKFKNAGDAPLIILGSKTSCAKCTVASMEKTTFSPGEEGAIGVQVRTEEVAKGTESKLYSVFLATNDPIRKSIVLNYRLAVAKPVSCKPALLQLGRIRRTQRVSGKVSVFVCGNDVEPIVQPGKGVEQFLEVAFQDSPLSPTLEAAALPDTGNADTEFAEETSETQEAFREFVLTYELKRDAPAGLLAGDIFVLTKNRRMPRVAIPVTAEVLGSVVLGNDEVVFTGRRNSGAVEKRISLTLADPDIKILKVESSVEGLSASVDTSGARSPALVLSLDTAKAPKLGEGTVTVSTSAPDMPLLRVRVMVTLQE